MNLEELEKLKAHVKELDEQVGLKPETLKEVNRALELERRKIEMRSVHITVAITDFKCPYCQKEYDDKEDKYLNRCNRNKSGITHIICSCGKRFGMTYDVTGQAVGFDLDPNNLNRFNLLNQ